LGIEGGEFLAEEGPVEGNDRSSGTLQLLVLRERKGTFAAVRKDIPMKKLNIEPQLDSRPFSRSGDLLEGEGV